MCNQFAKAIAAGLCGLGLGTILIQAAAPSTPQGIITAKGFLNIGTGTAVADLTGNAKFPDEPDVVNYSTYFEWNATGDINTAANNAFGDGYGVQMLGYFYPPATGDYVFLVASDDNSQLFLSPDDQPGNKKLIAQQDGWSDPRNWDIVGSGTLEAKNSSTFTGTQWATKDAATGGARITLTKGKAYYIEALMKEGTGGDNLAVAVQAPDGSIDSTLPIPGEYLSSDKSSGPVKVVTQPQSLTAVEGQPAKFSVVVDGLPPYEFQWQKSGVDLADATNATLIVSRVLATDNGAKFTCKISNATGSITSDAASLTVSSDTTAPSVAKISSDTSFASVVIRFSEPVSDSALKASNYSLDQAVTIASVVRVDEQTVKLTTSKLSSGIDYTLTLNGIQDTAVTPNTIAANTKATVRAMVYLPGAVVHQKYVGIDDNTGNTIEGLFNDPRFPGAPDRIDLMNMFEYPVNAANRDATLDPERNYFDCIEGLFIPPATGNYVFFVAFADRCWLYLSTDENPSNKYQILGLQGWSDPRRWVSSHDYDTSLNRTDTATSNQWPEGSTIHLQANQKYYMLLAHHDPSWAGGDWFAATYKLETDEDPLDTDVPKLTGSVIGTYVDPNGASVTFATQPKGGTFQVTKTATLTAQTTGTSLYGSAVSYQWQSATKGSSAFTDIAGATLSSYTTPSLAAGDDGKQYRVVASVPGYSKTSDAVSLSVVSDNTPPVPSVGVVKNGSNFDVCVSFDEKVDSSLATQSNYSVSAGTVTGFKVWTNSPGVVLTVSGLTSGSKYSVTVKNVGDLLGNKIASVTKEFTAAGLSWGVVGANELGFSNGVVAIGANGFDVYSGSISEWATYDESTFAYEQVTGDFDKKLRVEYQDASSQWARAGLVCRDVTNFGVDRTTQEGGAAGRYQKVHVNPSGPTLTGPGTAGNNTWEGNRRLDTGLETTSAGGGGTPLYPNAWCRLQRKGDLFTIFRSDDGVNWTQLGTTTFTTPMPATLYVGPEFAPENGNITNESDRGTFLAKFRDYGDVTAGVPELRYTVASGGTLTLTFTGTLQAASTLDGPWADVSTASPQSVSSTAGNKFYRAKR